MSRTHAHTHTKDIRKMDSIQVLKSGYKPMPWEWVKIRYEGKDRATVIAQLRPTLTHIKKISATHYEVLKTGEVKEYKEMTGEQNRLIRRQTLQRTFSELKATIRANFVNDGEKGCLAQLFITLTYAKNMQDERQLYKDFNLFWTNITNQFPDYGLEYISVAEPQDRGAWHFHVMVKSTKKNRLYIDKEIVNKYWPHGMSTTERLKSDDIGNYYIAYFTGVLASTYEDSAADQRTSEEVHQLEQDQPKSVVKGARLYHYPKNFKFWRRSRGIVKPDFKSDLLYGVQEDWQEVKARSYDIIKAKAEENESEILNRIYKAEYKRKSKKGVD